MVSASEQLESIKGVSNSKLTGPNTGRTEVIKSSLDNLNSQELNKMNRIIDQEHNKKQETILDKPFGEVINNTVNFFGNSFEAYQTKLIEAEFSRNLYDTEHPYLDKLQKHLIAIVLFIRDEDNVIYLGIIMIILSVLICFFNISRTYGRSESNDIDTKS
tara:strand:+ start:1213 stop:1692 length:480 start_codon:yes stop_codon:yes gene_type:complete